MKKILVTIVLALSATTAQATPVDTMCQSVASTAGIIIMQARQDGVAVTNITAALRQSPLNSVSKAHTMIQTAYQQPKYNTDRYVKKCCHRVLQHSVSGLCAGSSVLDSLTDQ